MIGIPDLLSVASGSLVGLTLGLVGGGGSILAVPLLVYVVGVSQPHIAIGTSAVAVAASAAANLFTHARMGTVKWPCALVFAAVGIIGAAAGAALGKAVDGAILLSLFGALMVAVGLYMLRPPVRGENPDVRLTSESAAHLLPKLVGLGLPVGFFSGFFGIGGGFLIVPGLVRATAMPLLNAIGSSLVAVATFGLTTAASYAYSGLVDWRISALFVLGGVAGGVLGAWLARRLAREKRILSYVFAGIVVTVGAYIVAKGIL